MSTYDPYENVISVMTEAMEIGHIDKTMFVSNEELLTCSCDVLVPAALENQITAELAPKLNCSYIVEAANGPTSKEADFILLQRGIKVVPDIFANSGGVIVSYFEWVQNIQELTWERDQVNEMLEKLMSKSFADIIEVERFPQPNSRNY